VAYPLYFWSTVGATGRTDEQIYAALRDGDWECVAAAAGILDFRRDLISSDPHWMRASLLPHPDSGLPQDRFLVVLLPDIPTEDALRDLRYVGLRNRLTMFDPQTAR
jgi:hypothetical protein